MRRIAIGLIGAALWTAPAAADITVLSPGIVNGPLRALAEQWTARTGHKVTITGANVGRIRDAVQSDAPADLVLAPTSDFANFTGKLAAQAVPVGRIQFGVVVKAGGRHPDISSEEKFVAFTKKAGALAFTDPVRGSLSGAMVEQMLKRPQFTGVKPVPVRGMIGDAIVRGDAEFGGGAISEELNAKGAEVVGPFPDSLGLFIDMSGAVLKVSANADEARAFLVWAIRPDSGEEWKKGGIVAP
jgi:molybdate transport system substrate-binding protein